MTAMRTMAAAVRDGERFWHLNTGEMYVVVDRDEDGRLSIRRSDRSVWVWPDYLLSPHNFERMGPPVVLR